MSIYDEIGGRDAVAATVDIFYSRVVSDPAIASYFASTDMSRLKAHQRAFVSMALGGPSAYEGRDMASAHAGLNVTGEAFDKVVGHLAGTLMALGVPDVTIAQIAEALGPLKGDIVTAPATV